MANCPACAESIPAGTDKCPHCGIQIHRYESQPARRRKSSGISTLLIILGGGFVLLICGGIVAALFLPALLLPSVQEAREAARRSQCKNNLKMIGLALHNYHDVYKSFPPAFVADGNGNPMHSWRVLILPFIDEGALYAQYRFDEPWNGPNNSLLMNRMPMVYRCPSHGTPTDTNTAYAAVYGPNSAFQGSTGIAVRQILDGTSNTVAVGEVTGAGIPWMQPLDVDVTLHPTIGDRTGFSSEHTGGCHFLMVDGAVRFVPEKVNQETFKSLSTINGGEAVSDF